MSDLISRREALQMHFSEGLQVDHVLYVPYREVTRHLKELPSVHKKPKTVAPHMIYKNCHSYWCECGWHLGRKGSVNYCSECGGKVNWDAGFYKPQSCD